MWAYESVFYQIYPLGFCGAPFENDGDLEHRITKIADWIPHIKKLGANAIYFSPLFESDTHGYNTRDYKKIDVRLGDNEDFKNLCKDLHNNGIKAVVDGVFELFCKTPTIRRSTIWADRSMISRCPSVTGSKLPG